MKKEQVEQCQKRLRSVLTEDLASGTAPGEENHRLFELVSRSRELEQELDDLRDQAALLHFEKGRLRPLAADVRRWSLRKHPMIIEPLWGSTDLEPDPNAVIFVGSEDMRERVARLCDERGLELNDAGVGLGAGETRWQQLRRASVAVFEYVTGKKERAAVCHAFGAALVLGLVPTMLVVKGERLPFDFDLAPVELDGETDEARLAKLLDRAPYDVFRPLGEDSVAATLSRAGLDPCNDPIQAGMLLEAWVTGRCAIAYPVSPAAYPESDDPRCFHVMPFDEAFDAARDAVRKGCEPLVRYVRGDESKSAMITRAIWDDICRATCIVVDLTDLNPNVCLELGMAQALGKSVLPVMKAGQDSEDEDAAPALFPEIAKVRLTTYHAASQLTGIFRAFYRDQVRD